MGSLPGVQSQDIQDYPKTVRDAVTPLPFHHGGSTTLVAGTVGDVLKVSELRRFENADSIVTGTHNGGASTQILIDSTATFVQHGVVPGDEVVISTVAYGVLAVTETTLTLADETLTLANTDTYVVNKRASLQGARAIEVRKFSVVTDSPIYLRLDGEASVTRHDAELNANETYLEDNVRVISRISAIGVSSTTTPKVRFTAWGI